MRVTLIVEKRDVSGIQVPFHFINIIRRSSVEGKVVQSGPTTMIWGFKITGFSLNKDNVGVSKQVTRPFFPTLVFHIPKVKQKPLPELERTLKVGDV